MASAAVPGSHAAAEAPPVDVGGGGAGAPRRLVLEELPWDHSFVRELPGDPRSDTIPREVPACLLPLRSLLAAWLHSAAPD
jgi:serine/tyrosine/threonine adenylyltransferase